MDHACHPSGPLASRVHHGLILTQRCLLASDPQASACVHREARFGHHDLSLGVMESVTSQPTGNVRNSGVKTEASHLQRLMPEFAAQTDRVLYVTDGAVETEMPAHAEVLAKHSRVLADMVTACKDPRIYMVDDSLSEVKAMLAMMYRPLARGFEATPMTSGQLLPALLMAHKYGMETATSAVESQLVAKVKHAANSNFMDDDTVEVIFKYAAAGEKFGLRQLRAYSEAYIAVNLENLGDRDLPLSSHSLSRIAKAVAKRLKSAIADIATLVPALEHSKERHAEYEAVITDALQDRTPDCPACSGHIFFQKFGRRRQGIRCSEKWCRWMPLQTEVQHLARMNSTTNKPHIIDCKECFGMLLDVLLSE